MTDSRSYGGSPTSQVWVCSTCDQAFDYNRAYDQRFRCLDDGDHLNDCHDRARLGEFYAARLYEIARETLRQGEPGAQITDQEKIDLNRRAYDWISGMPGEQYPRIAWERERKRANLKGKRT